MENVITEFLRHLKIPISKKYIKTFLLSHTEYPSLLSLSDLFENLGVNYSIHRIDKEKIEELEFPYLLPLEKSRRDIIEIRNRRDFEKQKANLEYWNGVVIQVESTHEIPNPKHNLIFKKEKVQKVITISILSGLAIFLGYSLFSTFTWFSLTWTMTSIAGIIVSYYIFTKDLGVEHSIIERFCNAGKTVNCDKILKSENSKIFNVLKFSDLVISFFLFQLILLLFLAFSFDLSGSVRGVFLLYSIATIPIVAYSIYIQYVIEKTWCLLCVLVTFVLVIQFMMILTNGAQNYFYLREFYFPVFMLFSILYLIILGVTYIIRIKIEESNENYLLAVKASRIKNSSKVFFHLLKQQKEVDITPLEYEMTIGNPYAPIKIIFVSNLYCAPCKAQHEVMSQLVNSFPSNITVSFRFVKVNKYFNNDISVNQYLIQYWYSNIFGKKNEHNLTVDFLKEWYENMDITTFAKRKPIKSELDESVYKIENQQSQFIMEAGVFRTPSIFINGFELPELYNLSDLNFLILEFSELLSKQKNDNMIALL